MLGIERIVFIFSLSHQWPWPDDHEDMLHWLQEPHAAQRFLGLSLMLHPPLSSQVFLHVSHSDCQGRDPKICLLQNEAVGGAVEQDHGEGGVQLRLDEWAQSIGASRLQVEGY